MTIRVRGRNGVRAYFARLPADLKKVGRGAARAGAKVIAEEAEANTPSDDVRDAIFIKTKLDDQRASAVIDVRPGWARSVATWLEYGTEAHFVRVDESQAKGRGLQSINRQVGENKGNSSLVIGGKFVGATVWHPGARPHPFLRPALDTQERAAIAAAQAHVRKSISRGRVISGPDEED